MKNIYSENEFSKNIENYKNIKLDSIDQIEKITDNENVIKYLFFNNLANIDINDKVISYFQNKIKNIVNNDDYVIFYILNNNYYNSNINLIDKLLLIDYDFFNSILYNNMIKNDSILSKSIQNILTSVKSDYCLKPYKNLAKFIVNNLKYINNIMNGNMISFYNTIILLDFIHLNNLDFDKKYDKSYKKLLYYVYEEYNSISSYGDNIDFIKKVLNNITTFIDQNDFPQFYTNSSFHLPYYMFKYKAYINFLNPNVFDNNSITSSNTIFLLTYISLKQVTDNLKDVNSKRKFLINKNIKKFLKYLESNNKNLLENIVLFNNFLKNKITYNELSNELKINIILYIVVYEKYKLLNKIDINENVFKHLHSFSSLYNPKFILPYKNENGIYKNEF